MLEFKIGARGITNRGSFRDFKSRQKDYKSGEGFQIGAEITNRGKRDFKSGHGLQIGAEHPPTVAQSTNPQGMPVCDL